MASFATPAFVLSLGACGHASQVAHFSPIVDVPKVAAASHRPSASPRSKGLLTAVCGERAGCRLLGRRSAGVDAEGHSLDVVTVVSSPPGLDPPSPEGPAEAQAGDEGDEAETDGVATVVTEYWMVVLDEGQVVSSQLLAEAEGPEGRGRRESDVKVGDNFFRIARSGGSNRQWEESAELRLSPLGPRSWARRSWTLTAGATAYEEERWDWAEFRGQTVWFEEACGEGRERSASAPQFPPPGELPAEPYFAYAALPSVELDGAYAAGLWRETGLGRCSLRIDGGGGGGYALQGRADGPSDSSLRAVLDGEGKALYIEAFDDKLVGAGGAADDRVEVLVDMAPSAEASRRCGEAPGVAKLAAWSIRAYDGALVGGKGRPGQGAPRVEHVRAPDGRSVRLKVTLPGPTPGAITLAYHDTDDGRRVERSFASSRLRRGEARTLGYARALAPHEAVCKPREGRLEPEFAASFDPYEPVVSSLQMSP